MPSREARHTRAECRAVVAGGGLDVDLAELARLQQPTVRRAVQRHASGQSEAASSGGLPGVPADMEHHVVQTLLERGGDVAMHVADLGIGRAGWYEFVPEDAAGRAVRFAVFARAIEMQQGNPDAAIVQPLDRAAENARNREGSPYGASPMILCSSELKSNPRWRVIRE